MDGHWAPGLAMGLSRGQWCLLVTLLVLLTCLQLGTGLAAPNFTAPPKAEGSPVPAELPRSGYYLTLRANRALYLNPLDGRQLRLLRVGNDTGCLWTHRSCNHPLPDPGPYRVKFLVMSDGGPVAETEWSEEIDLQRAQSLQAAARSHSPNSEVIITALSVLLAVLAAALLTLLVYTCFTTCRNTPISGPGDPMQVRRYNTHHMFSPPASGSS
ncbi:uroplakin-3b-like protein 1 isoform X2 [Erinaceus europaeus]|uniref:Uroplakin-3b-like protein 1 isoform X2 n=1 Tax=Erinaceus europaeus TaxID=9365 RepID=A0ABM3VYP1_ERIEU|nr:uroplakin-3b-like protein 1 isoform X2 [Erinaceus europaeus]